MISDYSDKYWLPIVVDVLRDCRQNENPESNMRIDCFDFINGTFVRRPGENCQVTNYFTFNMNFEYNRSLSGIW